MNRCGSGAADDVHFTFAATGDTFPHVNIQAVGEAQGYDTLFDYIRPFLQAADIAYTNFDGAMLASSPYTGYPAFNYNPQLATALKNAGIGVVSTANNHILDRGPQGIDATLAVLEQAGIRQHGVIASGASAEPRPSYLPITLSRDGVSITVGFLSFTWGTNGIPDPHNQVNLLWQSNSYGAQGGIRQSVLDAIAQARQETDIVVVAPHWGYEYQFYPDQSQVDGAHAMAAAGADVILGAQPHTLQPVDVINIHGRTTLVIYSLANFIASQGAYQATFFSNTSAVFYVGFIRHADGSVSLSGYRYLPMTMTPDDIRPVPIAAHGQESLINHVRQKMRDPHGLRQVAPEPPAPGSHIEVCPTYTFADASGQPVQTIGGDFAQYIATLGNGTTPRPLHDAIEVFGYPLGPVQQELTGNCQHPTSVLYTERQRLEWHPGNDWPTRVIGTQLGTAVYQQRYSADSLQRRVSLGSEAIVNEQFRAFYTSNGGLSVFGYPISGELVETDQQSGEQKTVQYFERARFELVPGAPGAQGAPDVQLGLLGREFAGMEEVCGPPAVPELAATQPTAPPAASVAAEPAAQAASEINGGAWWFWPLTVALVLVVLGGTAYLVQDWQHRKRYRERRHAQRQGRKQQEPGTQKRERQETRPQKRARSIPPARTQRPHTQRLRTLPRYSAWKTRGLHLYWGLQGIGRRLVLRKQKPRTARPGSRQQADEKLLRRLLDINK
jgi:poly-gamma-glutamate capsule biosynthesis protein CapA/YwtB (metallophosphatase superfamily)